MTKSTTQFPAYSDAVRDAMKAETPAFVQYVLWTGDHKLSTLLTSPVAFVSSALAPDLRRHGRRRDDAADGDAARGAGPRRAS